MKSALTNAAVALLLVSLAGCGRKNKPVVPPAAVAPVLPITAMVHPPLLPPIPPPIPRSVVLAPEQAEAPPPPPPPPHRAPRRRPRAAADEAAADQNPAPAATPEQQQQALNAQPSDMSPIGQLSTVNDNSNDLDRHSIVELITSTENGLNGIRRKLSDEEQKTATQIRTFLTKATAALKVDDLAGAKTLATKAHLLLDELTK